MSDELDQILNSSLPASLLQRLHNDETHALLDATPTDPSLMASYAESRLLSLTPKALFKLDTSMDNQDPKIVLSAANSVLDRSPATRNLTLNRDNTAPVSLPASAIAELLRGLGTFLGTAAGVPAKDPPPMRPAPEQETFDDNFNSPSSASMPIDFSFQETP